jgi:hypothetical protein
MSRVTKWYAEERERLQFLGWTNGSGQDLDPNEEPIYYCKLCKQIDESRHITLYCVWYEPISDSLWFEKFGAEDPIRMVCRSWEQANLICDMLTADFSHWHPPYIRYNKDIQKLSKMLEQVVDEFPEYVTNVEHINGKDLPNIIAARQLLLDFGYPVK